MITDQYLSMRLVARNIVALQVEKRCCAYYHPYTVLQVAAHCKLQLERRYWLRITTRVASCGNINLRVVTRATTLFSLQRNNVARSLKKIFPQFFRHFRNLTVYMYLFNDLFFYFWIIWSVETKEIVLYIRPLRESDMSLIVFLVHVSLEPGNINLLNLETPISLYKKIVNNETDFEYTNFPGKRSSVTQNWQGKVSSVFPLTPSYCRLKQISLGNYCKFITAFSWLS